MAPFFFLPLLHICFPFTFYQQKKEMSKNRNSFPTRVLISRSWGFDRFFYDYVYGAIQTFLYTYLNNKHIFCFIFEINLCIFVCFFVFFFLRLLYYFFLVLVLLKFIAYFTRGGRRGRVDNLKIYISRTSYHWLEDFSNKLLNKVLRK